MPSTEVTTKPDSYRALTIPDEQFAGALAAMQEQEVGEFDLTRIKVPPAGGQVWTIPGIRGDEDKRVLECIVVYAKFSRGYWDRPFSGGNEPPVCASVDGRVARARPQEGEGGELTIPEIPAEKDDQGRYLCDTCHFAEFGTKRNEKGERVRGQACKQMRQLFILLPDRLLPCVVTLPPTSLKSAKTYFLGLIDSGFQSHQVVTKISLVKTKNEGTPEFSQATFQLGDELPAEMAARAQAYADAAKPRFSRVVATAADLSDDSR